MRNRDNWCAKAREGEKVTVITTLPEKKHITIWNQYFLPATVNRCTDLITHHFDRTDERFEEAFSAS